MQLKKKFSLTAQELSHAQWAVGTGNFDTELGKAIQRKLLGYLVGTQDDDVTLLPIVADDLMDNRSVNFTLGIDEGDDTVCADHAADAVDRAVLTCEFVIQANELDELEDLDADDPATEETVADWVNDRKTKELIEAHGHEMWRLCQFDGVVSFEDLQTEVVEREDGSVHVTYSVAPVYKIH